MLVWSSHPISHSQAVFFFFLQLQPHALNPSLSSRRQPNDKSPVQDLQAWGNNRKINSASKLYIKETNGVSDLQEGTFAANPRREKSFSEGLASTWDVYFPHSSTTIIKESTDRNRLIYRPHAHFYTSKAVIHACIFACMQLLTPRLLYSNGNNGELHCGMK